MMKCPVCGNEVDQGRCKVCGYSINDQDMVVYYRKMYEMIQHLQEKVNDLENRLKQSHDIMIDDDQYEFYKASFEDLDEILDFVCHLHVVTKIHDGSQHLECILGDAFQYGQDIYEFNSPKVNTKDDLRKSLKDHMIFCLKENQHIVGCMKIIYSSHFEKICISNIYCEREEVAKVMLHELKNWIYGKENQALKIISLEASQNIYCYCPPLDLAMYERYKRIGFMPQRYYRCVYNHINVNYSDALYDARIDISGGVLMEYNDEKNFS